MWSMTLEKHLQDLREDLLIHHELWPLIAKRTGLAQTTVKGFARNYGAYKNPRLGTVLVLSDTLTALKDQLFTEYR